MLFVLLFISLSVVSLSFSTFLREFILFSNRSPSARRRRFQKPADRSQRETIIPSNAANISRKSRFLIRIFGKDKLPKRNLNYDVLNATNSINSTSLSDVPRNMSNSTFPKSLNTPSNSEDNMNLSTSSGKRDKSISISRVNNNEKAVENGNAWIKPPNHQDNNKTSPPIQHSSVTVIRVNKSAKLNETDNNQKDKSQTMNQEELQIPSTARSRTGQVNVIKIPRKKADMIQRERSASICSVSVINLEKSSVEMKPMKDQKKSRTAGGVTVTKIPRNSNAKQSHQE
jgi:hypothetical protein